MWHIEPGSKRLIEPGAKFSLHTNYFLFQKVDVAANTIPAAGSESVLLVTAGLQICLQFDRVGVRGVEVCLQTRAKRVGGSYHSTHSPLLYNLIGAKPPLGPKAPHRGWAEGPITVPRQLGLGSEGPQPKLPPLGRRLESWFGLG